MIPLLLDVPFLPPGRGGLILIFGGISMLSCALWFLMVAPAPIPDGAKHPSGGVGRLVGQTQRSMDAVVPVLPGSWHQSLQFRAAAAGIGQLTFQAVGNRRCVVVIGSCRSCQRRRAACEHERRCLERSARCLDRRARVEEICCRVQDRPQCAFLIELSG